MPLSGAARPPSEAVRPAPGDSGPIGSRDPAREAPDGLAEGRWRRSASRGRRGRGPPGSSGREVRKKSRSPLDPTRRSGYDTASSSPRSRSRRLDTAPLDSRKPQDSRVKQPPPDRGGGSCEGTGFTSPAAEASQRPSPGKSAVVSASGERRSRWEGSERSQSS